jgi:hypothetical protein
VLGNFGTVTQQKVGEIEKIHKINLDLNLGDSITENLLHFVSKLFYKKIILFIKFSVQ